MEIILETLDKKVLSETNNHSTGQVTNTMAAYNFGRHATSKIRNGSDIYSPVWKVGDLSIREINNGISTNIKADFTYRPMESEEDDYRISRTIIIMRNQDQTVEERRIIFYDKDGSIEQDKVEVSSLVKTSPLGYGTLIYKFDEQTGQYISEAKETYRGQITNDWILDRVGFLVFQADNLLKENQKKI